MIQVRVRGTPIRYRIRSHEFAWEKPTEENDPRYVPGEVVQTCLGRLRCEEVRVSDGGISQIVCSVARK